MTAHTIPREQWGEALEGFGEQHRDWLVSIRRRRAEDPPEVLVEEAPLDAVRVDVGPDPDAEAVHILVRGRDGDGTVELLLRRPWSVSTELAPGGEHAGLTVVSHEGERIEVRFRAAALPEAVDGVI